MTFLGLDSQSPKFNISKIEATPMSTDQAHSHIAAVLARDACDDLEVATNVPLLKENTESSIAAHLGAAKALGIEELFLSKLANLTGWNWLPNVRF